MQKYTVQAATFFMLMFLLYEYINYFSFSNILPQDIFRVTAPQDLSAFEVMAWKIALTWVIPGLLVLLFMSKSGIAEHVVMNWGAKVILAVAAFKFFKWLLVSASLFAASKVPGGGFLVLVAAISQWITLYTFVLVKILLLAGTLKMFMSLKPAQTG